jgi:hypothetical protein
MKNSNNTLGNRAHDLPPCSAVPQPTAPLRAPSYVYIYASKFIKFLRLVAQSPLHFP